MAHWATQAAVREYQLASNGELTVVERLASLLETGQYADVTVRVGEGDDVVSFKAHRLLLATASQPLNNLVASNIKNGPGEAATLRVTDVNPDAFQHILKYIYTDNLQVRNAAESMALLKAGEKWGLKNLTEKTVTFLDNFLNEYEPTSEERKNELCDLTVLSEEYGLDLATKCWTVLLKHVNDVVPCQGFLSMSKRMVKRLITHPDFSFKNQLVLFEAIRDWGMNQVLLQNLSVNCLQGLIGEFLNYIDFRAIKDIDFLDTILPSECLGKSEIIAFFMARGLEIPRDLVYNNNTMESDPNYPYEKIARYKRGYKLPNQEIYKEHELRFRVDRKIRLLGVGFGFLFSNTDMGITVHCQGPWETRQWKDIIQTYCRVSYEKMKTADVRLMFSEPVIIEPNQSYKVLVRISRMSTGSSDVDLWGGTQGVSRLEIKGAEISFLKSAVDPDKEVKDSDTENKPGMITDLIYELINTSASTSPVSPSIPLLRQDKKKVTLQAPLFDEAAKKKPEESFTSPSKLFTTSGGSQNQDSKATIDSHVNTAADLHSQVGSISSSSYSFRRNVPSARIEVSPPLPSQLSPKLNKKSHVDEASSYYLAHKPSSIRGSDIPNFLRLRQPSVEKSKNSWQIPSKTRSTTNIINTYKPREPSVNRESSASKEQYKRYTKPSSHIFEDSPLSKYSSGISRYKSKYEQSPTTDSKAHDYNSATQYSSPRYRSTAGSSYLNSISSSNKPESQYSSIKQPSHYTPSVSDSRYSGTGMKTNSRTGASIASDQRSSISRYTPKGSDTRYSGTSTGTSSHNISDNSLSYKYGSGTSSSKRGSEQRASPPKYGTSSISSYKYDKTSQNLDKEIDASKSASGTFSSTGRSRFGSYATSNLSGAGSKLTSSTLNTSTPTAMGSSTKYGSSISGSKGISSSLGLSKRYESSTPGSVSSSSSHITPSRFVSASSTTTGANSSLESRYGGASSSTPSYLSSSRYGTSSPFGGSYSSISNRFGSSIYRR